MSGLEHRNRTTRSHAIHTYKHRHIYIYTHSQIIYDWSLTLRDDESESCSVVSNSLGPHGLRSPWNFLGQNTGVRSLSLLQGIFPTQGSNTCFPHWRWILHQLSHKGRPRMLEWVAYPFFSRSSWPRNWTGVSCIAGRFLTNWAMMDDRNWLNSAMRWLFLCQVLGTEVHRVRHNLKE